MIELSLMTRSGVCTGDGPCDASKLGEGKNWVTKADPVDGLGPYVHAIAHALQRTKGMSESQSIATAVAAIKSWAAGGGKVTAATRDRAREAVAHWEAIKAKAHTGARSVSQDNTAYRLGIADRQAGKPKLTAAAYRQAHPSADADDYPLYEAGYAADRDDLELKLVPDKKQRALAALAALDVAMATRDGMAGVAEWGASGPPSLDASGSGSLLPQAPIPKPPRPQEAQLVGDDLPHHRFVGNNLMACGHCGRPARAEVHKRPKG